jgi:hypothetical protein
MGDWGSSTYIYSQIFVALAYLCLFATYQIKSRSKLLATTITSNILMGGGFILLNAWVGLAMCCVAICRDVVSEILNHKRSEQTRAKNTKLDWGLLTIWATALIALTVLTEEGWVTWFALFATLTFTVSIWQKNVLVYRVLGIFVGIFWIIYNVGVESFFGITLESVLLVGVIIGLGRFLVKLKKNQPTVEST